MNAQNDPVPSLIHRFLSNLWWIVLLRGILLAGLGLLLLVQPVITVLILVQFLGFYWLIDGIFSVIHSFRGREHDESWKWGLCIGILGILAGLVVLSRPLAAALFTNLFLVYLLAFQALFSGFVSITRAVKVRKRISNEWTLIIGGILWILFGIFLLAQPILSVVLMLWMIGISSLLFGSILIGMAFVIRSRLKRA